jgi:hypothetical protein
VTEGTVIEAISGSEYDDILIRQTENSSAQASRFEQTDQSMRVVKNKQISALSQQVMELIIDNIRTVHMNAKLSQYLKQQAKDLEKYVAEDKQKPDSQVIDQAETQQVASHIDNEEFDALQIKVRSLLTLCHLLIILFFRLNLWKKSSKTRKKHRKA